jgi:hypothetical protein
MKTTVLSLFFALLFLNGCKKDDLIKFEDANQAVVFPEPPASSSREYLTTFSFQSVAVGTPSAIVTIPVRVVGIAVPFEREVGVQILEEGTTATAGQYRFLGARIPANETSGTIEIEVDYADELLTEERVINMILVPSKDLNAGPREFLKGKLVWHCQLLPPATSNAIRTYNILILSPLSMTNTSLNYYSPAAHRLIMDVFGWEELPSYSAGPYYIALNYAAYRQKLRAYIAEWNIAHPDEPLLHNGGLANGELIQIRD